MGTLISKLSRLSVNDEKVDNVKPIENCVVPDEQILNTPKEKFIADQILDPRSATIGIRRTPLVLVKVGVDTPVRPRLYLETDLDETNKSDISSCISEFEESNSSEHLLDIEEGLEAFSNDAPLSDVEIEEILEETNNANINLDIINVTLKDKVKKTYIYEDIDQTPESTPVKPKGGRTPLSVVSTNNSPLPSPLGKPWRGIREERLRLGLENTPPNQEPYPDVVQSAPGKFGVKRTAKKFNMARAHWALDESIVI